MSATNPCTYKPYRQTHSDQSGKKIEYETRFGECKDVDDPKDGEIDVWQESTYEIINGKQEFLVEKRKCDLWSGAGSCKTFWTGHQLQPNKIKSTPVPAPAQKKAPSREVQIEFVARVLFCETANATDEERKMVASVIHNRIKARGFGGGRLLSSYEVVKQPKGFSCIGDRNNVLWRLSKSNKSRKKLSNSNEHAWKDCAALAKQLVSGKFKPSDKDAVYYHDLSIETPKSWLEGYYQASLLKKTDKFKFFSISNPIGEK